ncbi:MAG: DUF521 domain-containing protein [Rhizobiaceae bacterium]|nr:aconitase X [Hyphomicrobiales bacterium]NRB31806.1 DUF521 domain-containing protein [Rhizobiaceae bacterium]
MDGTTVSTLIVAAKAQGPVVTCEEGLSFWGGVDPKSGTIIDAHHPQFGACLAGRIVLMPTSRGSCSGSGVLLELAMKGLAPAALVFREPEDVLTLGALVASEMFDCSLAVLRLSAADYQKLSQADQAAISGQSLVIGETAIPLTQITPSDLKLTASDQAVLAGAQGPAAQIAMEILCAMASSQGAEELLDVTRAHIDGCIYASPANLVFAEAMADRGGQVVVPTTMNAISVDRDNWQAQQVPHDFGLAASRLADAYVRMGAQPTFTCAPYQSEDRPEAGEDIGWSESNAVIYANSVLGARSVKHPDFLDLFIALTGRAPASGVYLDGNRRAAVVINVTMPSDSDESFWPLLGWIAGHKSPDRIPLLRGLEEASPSTDDLRAVCASFGTTSAAPMFHMAGVTPEGELPTKADPKTDTITLEDFRQAWKSLNSGPDAIDLVALGSPHFSLAETRAFAREMAGQTVHSDTAVIITLSRATKAQADAEGLLARLEQSGVQVVSDLCWCSISEPVFPPMARTVMTNSGKYAHYGPGLSGRQVRFGSLSDCAGAAVTGLADAGLPHWLDQQSK